MLSVNAWQVLLAEALHAALEQAGLRRLSRT
jgi:hypothetical protein